MKIFGINRKDGFSLLEAIVAIAVMTIAGIALTRLNVTSMKANKSTMIRTDLDDIKRTISNTISCDNTLGAVKPSTCSGPVELKDKHGGNIAPGGKMGPWGIEATCEVLGGKNGLSIYATKRYPNGDYMKDPLRNLPLDKSHPISSLFDPSTRPCPGSFETPGSSQCPNGIESVNFEDRTFVCAQPTSQGYEVKTQSCSGDIATSCSAFCSPGKHVIGGGCALISKSPGSATLDLQNSAPGPATQWNCYFGGNYTTISLSSYAICTNID